MIFIYINFFDNIIFYAFFKSVQNQRKTLLKKRAKPAQNAFKKSAQNQRKTLLKKACKTSAKRF